jgi:hypothetical protein
MILILKLKDFNFNNVSLQKKTTAVRKLFMHNNSRYKPAKQVKQQKNVNLSAKHLSHTRAKYLYVQSMQFNTQNILISRF